VASNELSRLNAALNARSSFLVLTTEDVSAGVGALVISSASGVNLSNVFDRHYDFHLARAKGLEEREIGSSGSKSRLSLIKHFKSPLQIESFYERLTSGSGGSVKEIGRLAREAAQMGQESMRNWFGGLSDHEKLLGLLACLFEGIELRVLEALYVRSALKLRREGLSWIADPREHGIRESWPRLRLQSVGQRIQFEDKAVREELEWQIDNRRLLVWSMLKPIALEADRTDFWKEPGARSLLGTALGWAGIWEEEHLREVLEMWAHARGYLAEEPNNAMAALPGYALVEVLMGDIVRGRSRVNKLLTDWVATGDPDLCWAAGAAVWRLYRSTKNDSVTGLSEESWRGFRRQLLEGLRDIATSAKELRPMIRLRVKAWAEAEVAKKDSGRGGSETSPEKSRAEAERLKRGKEEALQRQLRSCVAVALIHIGEDDPDQYAATLAKWLNSESISLSRVALISVQRMFIGLVGRRNEPDLAATRPLLKIIGTLLTKKTAEADVIALMFSWLRYWMRWENWESEISKCLLDLANRGQGSQRGGLRAAISRYWLDQASGLPLSSVAESIVARSYVMDGILTDRPVLGHCVLVLDPELLSVRASKKGQESEASKAAERRKGAILQLLAAIQTQMEISVVLLGPRVPSIRRKRARAGWGSKRSFRFTG